MSVFTTGSLEVRDSSNNLVFGAGDGFGPNPFFGIGGGDRTGLNSTTITGSFQVIPAAGSTINIITGSVSSTGAKIGIGTVGASPPGTAIAVYGDMGLTDTAGSKTIAMSVIDAGSMTIGTDSANYGRFEYTAATNSVQLHTRVGASNKTELMLSNNQVSVGKGSAASSGIDLEVAGTNKTVLIGDNANPPASEAALFLGNEDTKIFHDTFLGGQLVLQSTGSIVLVGDRTIGASSSEFAYLKARNAASVGIAGREDIRVEAPGGLQVDNNLIVTGTIHTRGNEDGYERIIVENETSSGNGPMINLARIDGSIAANDTLGAIGFYGSEDDGVTKAGGAGIVAYATDAYSGGNYPAGLNFYTTRPGSASQYLAMTLDDSRNLTVENNITATGTVRVNGGSILDPSGNSVIQFDSSGDITLLSNGNITDQVFFQKSETDQHTATVNIFNTDNTASSGGSIKLATKHAVLLDDEVVGNVLFAAADTDVSAAPVTVSKIESRIADPGIAMATDRGSNLGFYSTQAGSTTLRKTHEMSVAGLTGSYGGIKIQNGSLNLPNVPEVIRAGQGVRPAIFLSDYSSDDVAIYRVDANGSTGYGFTLTYSGSNSGVNNSLELWADNAADTGIPVQVYTVPNDGTMSISYLSQQTLLGQDSEDSSADARSNPDNPLVSIAGRREYIDIGFARGTTLIPTKCILPASPVQGASDATFTDYDQSPEQWRYAWIAPCDGYIDAIQMLSDTAFGQSNSVSTTNMIDIDVYILPAAGASNLSSLSPDHTWGICYGWNSFGGTHAGDVKTWRVGETGTNLSLPANRSDTQFSAGDKIWFAFDGGSNTSNAKFPDGTTNSSTARINLKINLVLDERTMAT